MKLELSGFCYLEWRSVSLILGFCAIIWLSWGGFFVFLGTQQWNFVLFCLFFVLLVFLGNQTGGEFLFLFLNSFL